MPVYWHTDSRTEFIKNSINMIKIYSSPTCVYCNTLKAYLKEHAIEFEEINVAGNQKALKEMIEKSGQMGVPGVDIDGQIIVGFDREKIRQVLRITE